MFEHLRSQAAKCPPSTDDAIETTREEKTGQAYVHGTRSCLGTGLALLPPQVHPLPVADRGIHANIKEPHLGGW